MGTLEEHAWVDASQKPLYMANMPDCSEQELEDFYRLCEALYVTLVSEIVWVVDATSVTRSTAQHRKITVEHLERVQETARRYVVGLALVVNTPVVRGIITAIQWFIAPPCPVVTFEEKPAAMAWAQERLRFAKTIQR